MRIYSNTLLLVINSNVIDLLSIRTCADGSNRKGLTVSGQDTEPRLNYLCGFQASEVKGVGINLSVDTCVIVRTRGRVRLPIENDDPLVICRFPCCVSPL